MKAAFEEWRHWLEGAKHPFTVLTDPPRDLTTGKLDGHYSSPGLTSQ